MLSAYRVDVEVDISNGLHNITIVGLTDKAINESKDRISSAIKHSGFKSPKQKNQKVLISLAPANTHKSGPMFDLPITLAYLKSTGDIDFNPEGKLFVGELSLDGKLREVCGILPIVIFAKASGFSEIFLPIDNVREASLIEGIKIFGFNNLREVTQHLTGKEVVKPYKNTKAEIATLSDNKNYLLTEIEGQEKAKRALQIAASGGHNVGFYGPPGTGKTLLAKSIVEILPKLTHDQTIECTSIHSVVGLNSGKLITNPPFRNPHHTSSFSSLIGGGAYLKPGEITLAHNGILFLDEFPEFDRKVIESLRQPLEDGYIQLSRINNKAKLPTNFTLIVTMNPCPCGYFKTGIKQCTCSTSSINKYRKKISGPIIDRIDMWVEVNQDQHNQVILKETENTKINLSDSDVLEMKENILRARKTQNERLGEGKLNAGISHSEIPAYCDLNKNIRITLNKAADKLSLSNRAYHKILKIARTIADLEGEAKIKESHILEALQYRPKF